jgi:hypothetical protein
MSIVTQRSNPTPLLSQAKSQKLKSPLLLFPNGYTISAAKNNPTVIPIATWIMLNPTLKTIVFKSSPTPVGI